MLEDAESDAEQYLTKHM